MRLTERAVFVIAVAVATALVAPPALGADDEPNPNAPHCVETALPEGAPSAPSVEVCFPTFSDAVYKATGGALLLPEDFEPANLTEEMLLEAGGDSFVLSVEFWNRNYNENPNESKIYDAPYRCSDSISWQTSYVGRHNDKFSSARNYSRCNVVRHFEHSDFGGAKVDCSPCGYMGDAMNNRTSSIKWKHL